MFVCVSLFLSTFASSAASHDKFDTVYCYKVSHIHQHYRLMFGLQATYLRPMLFDTQFYIYVMDIQKHKVSYFTRSIFYALNVIT